MADKKGIVSLPASGGEAGLNRYLAEIKKFPILSPEEEYMLAKRWREHGDTEAAAKLVNSHLRLVSKIAIDRKSTRLNSSHVEISYAVFCLKKKMRPLHFAHSERSVLLW